jgi:hypothetical protein
VVIKQVAELTCEPEPYDRGEACDEVIDHLRVPERYRPPTPG